MSEYLTDDQVAIFAAFRVAVTKLSDAMERMAPQKEIEALKRTSDKAASRAWRTAVNGVKLDPKTVTAVLRYRQISEWAGASDASAYEAAD